MVMMVVVVTATSYSGAGGQSRPTNDAQNQSNNDLAHTALLSFKFVRQITLPIREPCFSLH
jgi:hypothetical protein